MRLGIQGDGGSRRETSETHRRGWDGAGPREPRRAGGERDTTAHGEGAGGSR
jgi:hypothetical protein